MIKPAFAAPDSFRVKPTPHPPITTLDGSAVVTVFEQHATPEARVARALASLSIFSDWTHQPMCAELESRFLELNEQELMTAAAACLLRLAKLKDQADHSDAA